MEPAISRTSALRQPRQATHARCAICARRAHETMVALDTLEADPEQPTSRRSWLVCPRCAGAVWRVMERTGLSTPIGILAAIGVVASERGPKARARIWHEKYWDQLDEEQCDRFITRAVLLTPLIPIASFIGAMAASLALR